MGWADVARRQEGIIGRSQLRSAGLSEDTIDGMLCRAELRAHARGVYAVRGTRVGERARMWIAVLVTRGTVGFTTAGGLWQVVDAPSARIEIIVPHERRVQVPHGVRVRRVFVPRSATTRFEGLPTTVRWWTVLDILGRSPENEAYRLADRALQQGWITTEQLGRRLADYPGRTGNRMLRLIQAHCSDGAAAESERRLHRLLRRARIAGWLPNLPVTVNGVVVARVDVGFGAQRLAVEVDGWAFHSDVDRFQRDRQRQNVLTTLGWTVLRFTWWDICDRPDYVTATIRAQLARAS